MAELQDITPLKNKYFILRHGESEANVTGLITSDPTECISHYGLTKHGKERVAVTVKEARLRGWLDSKTIIYCSDFKRTVETATLAQRTLHVDTIHPDSALRERYFGGYNNKHVSKYIEIWPQTEAEVQAQLENGVENAEEMVSRLLNFIKELESQHEHTRLLLVSHGDPLQVLQAAFAHYGAEAGRLLQYIEPAEVRELILAPMS